MNAKKFGTETVAKLVKSYATAPDLTQRRRGAAMRLLDALVKIYEVEATKKKVAAAKRKSRIPTFKQYGRMTLAERRRVGWRCRRNGQVVLMR